MVEYNTTLCMYLKGRLRLNNAHQLTEHHIYLFKNSVCKA